MNFKKHRKYLQAKVRYGNLFYWWFDKFLYQILRTPEGGQA